MIINRKKILDKVILGKKNLDKIIKHLKYNPDLHPQIANVIQNGVETVAKHPLVLGTGGIKIATDAVLLKLGLSPAAVAAIHANMPLNSAGIATDAALQRFSPKYQKFTDNLVKKAKKHKDIIKSLVGIDPEIKAVKELSTRDRIKSGLSDVSNLIQEGGKAALKITTYSDLEEKDFGVKEKAIEVVKRIKNRKGVKKAAKVIKNIKEERDKILGKAIFGANKVKYELVNAAVDPGNAAGKTLVGLVESSGKCPVTTAITGTTAFTPLPTSIIVPFAQNTVGKGEHWVWKKLGKDKKIGKFVNDKVVPKAKKVANKYVRPTINKLNEHFQMNSELTAPIIDTISRIL